MPGSIRIFKKRQPATADAGYLRFRAQVVAQYDANYATNAWCTIWNDVFAFYQGLPPGGQAACYVSQSVPYNAGERTNTFTGYIYIPVMRPMAIDVYSQVTNMATARTGTWYTYSPRLTTGIKDGTIQLSVAGSRGTIAWL